MAFNFYIKKHSSIINVVYRQDGNSIFYREIGGKDWYPALHSDAIKKDILLNENKLTMQITSHNACEILFNPKFKI